jgi:phosphatidylserine/phosphatidylglycerophosphate/cardiolipin synthase-like enzyme
LKRSISSTLTVLVILLIILVYQAITGKSGIVPPPTPPGETAPAAAAWYNLYFTNPNGPGATSLRGGPDEALVAAIDQARLSVDVAAYQLNLQRVSEALIAAHRRGVAVRMVTDSDYLDESEVQDLKNAGIGVLGDRREGLMHDKFVVIDRQDVWTGSMNLTVNGAYHNNNNLIHIRSSRLAQDYTTEFEEMFVDDKFGPGSPANTPYPTLSIDNTLLEVYFSPDDGVDQHILNLLQEAHQSINFLAYSFTSDDIAASMIARAKDGVSVSGVFEESQYRSNKGTEFDHLRNAGLNVRLDGNPRNMHHKVIILDGQTVITGSYNFTASAENSNDENVLVIHNAQIAAQYLAEFQRVFAEGQP